MFENAKIPDVRERLVSIEGLKEISRIDFCVIDLEGNVLAATFPESEEYRSSVVPFVDSPADSQVVQGHQFFKIYDELQVEYVLVAKGSSDDVYMIGKMAAFQIQNLLVAYKERFWSESREKDWQDVWCLSLCLPVSAAISSPSLHRSDILMPHVLQKEACRSPCY